MDYISFFTIYLILIKQGHSQQVFPIRISGVLHTNGAKECMKQSLESTKQKVSEVLSRHFPPPPTGEGCNCSQLIDSSRNESCITSCCGQGRLIFDADLREGSSFVAPGMGLTWLSSLHNPSGSEACDRQGVLRINFREACNFTQNCKLRFDFDFHVNYTGWNFNIGDSSNDGYGGDAGHTSNAAEVHNVDHNFLVLTNNLPGFMNATRTGNHILDGIPHVVSGNFTVVVGDEFVMFDNHNGVQRSYRSRYLFTLNGQPTTFGPVDYIINLGMNRVINRNSRSGTGLCRTTIKTLNC